MSADGVILAATIPFTLYAAKRVWGQLIESLRAKRALEAQVLDIAKKDFSARDAITAAASVGDATGAGAVIAAGVTKLSQKDKGLVRRGLDQGQHQGGAAYVLDIARHVNAKLTDAG